MKRLVLFVSIFGVGLLVFVLVLGPDRLWRRNTAPTIRTEDLPTASGAMPVSEHGQGRRFNIDMRGAFTLPLGWKSVATGGGAPQRLKVAQLRGSNSEPYAGGIHLENPVLETFAGETDGEEPSARVTAAAGDLETRGDLRTLSENFQAKRDLQSLTLGPGVKIEKLDPAGNVVLTLETARLEVPPTPESAASDSDADAIFPRLVGPEPVHVWSTDPPFDLHAAGFTMYRFDGRLELAGPVDLASGDLHVTSAGPSKFVRRVEAGEKKSGSERAAASGVDAGAPMIGPGTLTFDRDVVVRQKDPKSGVESWMKTDVVVAELEKAPAAAASSGGATLESVSKGLTVKKIDAGSRDGTVAFGLLGGEGVARHVTRTDDVVTLDGPVHVDHVAVGAGDGARTISLRADQRLELTPAAKVDGKPTRWRAVLSGAAHATSEATADAMDADADTLTADLLVRDDSAKGGAAADSSGFDLDALVLDGSAKVDLHDRGHAHARRIELAHGGQSAHLEGDAEVVTDRGTLRGPAIDLDVPEKKDAPMHVTVPSLTSGEIVVPPGMEWFGTTTTEPGAENKPPAERRLQLEPLGPASLEIVGDLMHLRGRTCVRAFESAPAPSGGGKTERRAVMRLTANSIDVLPDKSDAESSAKKSPPQVEASGDVDAYDFRNDPDPEGPGPHLHLLANHARTDPKPDPHGGTHRHLLLDGVPGTPASGTLPVLLVAPGDTAIAKTAQRAAFTIAAAHLDFDLDTQRIVADDATQRVAATIPESLVAPILPPGFGELPGAADARQKKTQDPAAYAAMKPLLFFADHVEITPPLPGEAKPANPPALLQGIPATSPFARALVTANGRIHADRPSDDSSFDAQSMRFDLARGLARIAGSAEQPVVLERSRKDIPSVTGLPDAADRIVTEWIDVTPTREGRPRIQLQSRKDLPVIVLYPSRRSDDGKPARRLRVELRCADPPELVDQHLQLTGGVDTWIYDETPVPLAAVSGPSTAMPRPVEGERAHIRSERVELLLSRPIGEPAVGESGPSLVRLSAQGRVHLDYGDYHATGALLTYEFAGSELVLKQGAERCQLLAADADGAWHATAEFERMTLAPVEAVLRPKGDPNRLVRADFEDFRLLLEAPNGR